MRKKYLFLTACITFLLMSGLAQALQFDLDGSGGGGNVIQFDTFDWGQSAALVSGGIPLSSQAGVPNNFTLFTHASLSAFKLNGSNANLGTYALDSNFEVTVVAGFGEIPVFSPVDPTYTKFVWDSGNSVNFVNFYISDAVNADKDMDSDAVLSKSAGTGFNDGTLLLTAKVYNVNGNFGLAIPAPEYGLLDNHNADSLNGLQTIVGSGNTTMKANVTYYNPNYFLDAINILTFKLNDTSNAATPFIQIDPANNFWDATANLGTGGYISGLLGVANDGPGGDINVGAINGVNGPDMIIQTDGSTAFLADVTVPEPTTLLLLGFGLLGFAGVARKKQE